MPTTTQEIIIIILIFLITWTIWWIIVNDIKIKNSIDSQCVLKNQDKIIEMKYKCLHSWINNCQMEIYKYFNCIK